MAAIKASDADGRQYILDPKGRWWLITHVTDVDGAGWRIFHLRSGDGHEVTLEAHPDGGEAFTSNFPIKEDDS